MKIPFTSTQFINVFKTYNETIGLTPFILSILALLVLFLIGKNKASSKIQMYFLSFLWAWTGIVYHWVFFATINPPAKIFGVLCVCQAFAFLIYGLRSKDQYFIFKKDSKTFIGITMIVYSLIIYPALGFLFGHIYPESPSFGAPCPSTIYTLGLLMLFARKVPVWLYLVPLLWVVIGFNAALSFSIYEDYGLLVSGIVFVCFRFIKQTGITNS
jgi:hypothetical protein